MLLSNVGGPLVKKKILLANVAMSVALYSAPVWTSNVAVTYR